MTCLNCNNFSWNVGDSEDPVSFIPCPHCKVTTYCSESCRSEHWLKLHQFHCDIMRGAKELPGGKHDRDSCLACKEESEAAGVNNNGLPLLPCYLPNNFVPSFQGCKKRPSHVFPVQLGEMTGNFDSKVEHTISILLRLMKKMMMDNHPLWTHYRSAYAILWNGLKEARERIWVNRVVYKAPKPPVELKDKIESVSEFHEMWKCVLELLSGRLAHFEDLKKAVCYGDLNKTCWGCYKDFTASKFFPTPSSWPDGTVSPLFMFGNEVNFSYCGKCEHKVAFERFLNMEQKWVESKRLEKCEDCDFCGQRGGQRHRCSTCRTKLYCGKECYDADQEVHKEFCKPHEEMMPWKVKEGFSGRRNYKVKKGEEDYKLNNKIFSKMQDLLKKM